jgi:hypothetical protein
MSNPAKPHRIAFIPRGCPWPKPQEATLRVDVSPPRSSSEKFAGPSPFDSRSGWILFREIRRRFAAVSRSFLQSGLSPDGLHNGATGLESPRSED